MRGKKKKKKKKKKKRKKKKKKKNKKKRKRMKKKRKKKKKNKKKRKRMKKKKKKKKKRERRYLSYLDQLEESFVAQPHWASRRYKKACLDLIENRQQGPRLGQVVRALAIEINSA